LLDTAPDGDSIHFLPEDCQGLTRLEPLLKTHPDGGITLRLDGIDALETHYLAPGGLGVLRQPPPWPERSAEALLQFLGFEAVQRRADERIFAARPAVIQGAIALRRVDKYGRGVGFAFRGRLRLPNHRPLVASPSVLRTSANWHLLRHGQAYPTFYQDMPEAMLCPLAEASATAQREGLGHWPFDRTHRGFTLDSLESLKQEALLLPKLFRRLADFVGGNGGRLSLAGFRENLQVEVGAVRLWPQNCNVEFADLLEVRGQNLRLLVPPDTVRFAND
jgi:endonuclease YncB( thermonuclease family)